MRPLVLLGEWDDPRRAPSRVWISDLTGSPVGSLLRLTKLARRVERDFVEVGEGAGLRDFVGRSFRGWHRHITLASAAHAATVLAASDWESSYGFRLRLGTHRELRPSQFPRSGGPGS